MSSPHLPPKERMVSIKIGVKIYRLPATKTDKTKNLLLVSGSHVTFPKIEHVLSHKTNLKNSNNQNNTNYVSDYSCIKLEILTVRNLGNSQICGNSTTHY